MQQIADWLKQLGMSEYAERFVESDIDTSVLRDLTDQDLKELGVSLGHRRKMLRAIAELPGAAPTSLRPAFTEPKTQDGAERRQVTVMFSDLVGSTALSARMDPEDLREVISAYQKCVAETVGRFGGFVAKFMGDGVLIYFGYPQAHEDDAERAVRAGLELAAAVTSLKTHIALQTRVGIATGLVVVGDLIGSGASQEQAIVGETPNLAARLQGVAEPNSVVIAESTRKLLGNLFELRDIGPQELKGLSRAARTWAALRPSSVESRFDAFHASGVPELVGREEELELLLRRWSKAKVGEGQVVLLSGEPGIGKSRLTAALLERLASEPHTRLRYFCSPQHTDSAFYPVISQMERAAGLVHDDTTHAKLDKLDAALAETSTPIQDAALFAEMLSLPNDGRYPALDLAPEERRQKTLAMRFGQEIRVAILGHRSMALWAFGYAEAALADTEQALRDAREISHAATLMYALYNTSLTHILLGNYEAAKAEADELAALADEKGALLWKAWGTMNQGCVLALTGKASDAVHKITSGITAVQPTGATLWMPFRLSHLTRAYAELGQFDDAWCCIDEALTAMETTKEKWSEAEVHRTAGEIGLKLPEPDAVRAEAYFERALTVARQQQAKSWELRAAMSMARLWRDQGKVQQARELLAPVYGWFTEGHNTRDLKDAKALLEELAS